MQLEEYLHSTMKEGETLDSRYSRFGRQIGVSLFAIKKWVNKQRRVNDDLKLKVVHATDGRVTLEDLIRG